MYSWKDKKILITGGAGFIGSNLSKNLAQCGAHITIIDNFERGRREDVSSLVSRISIIEGDLRDLDFCLSHIRDFDTVIHLASKVGGIGLYTSEPYSVFSANVLIDSNVLKSVISHNINRYFYASSAHVYPAHLQGSPNSDPIHEEQAFPADPELSYGWAKLIAEKEIQYAIYENPNLRVAIARYIGIYGENQDFNLATGSCIPVFVYRALKYPDIPFRVWGTGAETRSYCFIEDAIRGTKLMVEELDCANCVGPYNVGKQERISIQHLAEAVVALSGKDISIEYDSSKETLIWGQWCDCSSIKTNLGFKARVPLEKGLASVYNYLETRNK